MENKESSKNIAYSVERFFIFRGRLFIDGWVYSEQFYITKIGITIGSSVIFGKHDWFSSPDVAQVHGPQAGKCRFTLEIPVNIEDYNLCKLIFTLSDGTFFVVDKPGDLLRLNLDKDFLLRDRFISLVNNMVKPKILEIGSRNNTLYKECFNNTDSYIGFDIKHGTNVNVLGDAHELAKFFRPEQFDAVFSISVFEHLAMPWKVVLEINSIMKPGGLCFMASHQSWAVHEQPWDFWRFTDSAWKVLFNRATGFEVIDAAMGQKASLVPELPNSVTVLNSTNANCFQGSAVIAKKIGTTNLTWDINVKDIMPGVYPS